MILQFLDTILKRVFFLGLNFCRVAVVWEKFTSELCVELLAQSNPAPVPYPIAKYLQRKLVIYLEIELIYITNKLHFKIFKT